MNKIYTERKINLSTKYLESLDWQITINDGIVTIDEMGFSDYPKKKIWRSHKFPKELLLKAEGLKNTVPIITEAQYESSEDIYGKWYRQLKKTGILNVKEDELKKLGYVFLGDYVDGKIYLKHHESSISLDTFCKDKRIDFQVGNSDWNDILEFIKQEV